jgi:hypothetical protein
LVPESALKQDLRPCIESEGSTKGFIRDIYIGQKSDEYSEKFRCADAKSLTCRQGQRRFVTAYRKKHSVIRSRTMKFFRVPKTSRTTNLPGLLGKQRLALLVAALALTMFALPANAFTIGNAFLSATSVFGPTSWFSTFTPSRSLMLVVGGCLLLFGAFVRRLPALRRPQNQRTEVREGQARSGMKRTLNDSRIGDQIDPPSPHAVSPSNERSTQGTLPVFLAAQRVTADQAVGKES